MGSAKTRFGVARRKFTVLRKLVTYFVLVAVAAIPVGLVLGRAWIEQPWGLPRHALRFVYVSLEIDPAVPYFGLTGLFLGLAAVLLLDRFKRAQGIVLWTGLALTAVFAFLPLGVLVEPLVENATPVGVGVLAAGFLVGMGIGGVRLRSLEEGPPWEFPKAPRRLRAFTMTIVVVGLFDAAIAYRSPLFVADGRIFLRETAFEAVRIDATFVLGVVGSVLLYVGLTKFLDYEAEATTIQIGPRRSGKSAAFGGLYAWISTIDPDSLLEGDSTTAKAEDLAVYIKDGRFPPATEIQESDPLSINYDSRGWMPEKIRFQSVDYAGELLERVLSPVVDGEVVTDGGQWAAEDEEVRESEDEFGNGDDGNVFDDIDDIEAVERIEYGDVETWEEAVGQVERAADNDETGAAVWNCVTHADRVILTVPFDDFIGPVAARENEPDYVDIERVEVGSPRLDDFESHEIVEQRDGIVYCWPDKPERPPADDYLSWYMDLVREFNDEKEFVVVVTMTDFARRDFDGHPRLDMPEFREHVYEIMASEWARIEHLQQAAAEEYPFVLFYDIDNVELPDGGTEMRIDTAAAIDNDPILGGADRVLERLRL